MAPDIPKHDQWDFTHAPTLHLAMEIIIDCSNATEAMSLTFLNTTGAPRLSSAKARAARAHVTKVNFKQRRQRLAIERLKKGKEHTTTAQERSDPIIDVCAAVLEEPRIPQQVFCHPEDPDHSIQFLLHEFRPLVFPAQTGADLSPSELEWITLLRSEPALVEACMYVALEYWPSGACWKQKRQACVHLSKALNMVNSRLSSDQGLADGVIGAVFVLTFGEKCISTVYRKWSIKEEKKVSTGYLLGFWICYSTTPFRKSSPRRPSAKNASSQLYERKMLGH
ncbi:unnamed protein product [Clonostachys rosea]|uniref:Uncharacterized protein n=1 Tax=Bionectria ochroleuca TaxID=29856 RepID=A0ABY6TZ16_BIOOC|nr:unnamed protein product [Clonostachys rosea]